MDLTTNASQAVASSASVGEISNNSGMEEKQKEDALGEGACDNESECGQWLLDSKRGNTQNAQGTTFGRKGPSSRKFSHQKYIMLACAAMLIMLSLYNYNVVPHLFTSSTTMPKDDSVRPVTTVSKRSPAAGSDPRHKPDFNDDSFRLENLRLGGKICCGDHKCFFLLKHRSDMAYVVLKSKDSEAQTEALRSLSEAWKLGQKLEQNYSQLQLTLAPPEVIKIDEEFANKLNANRSNCNNGKETSNQRYRDGYVIVQKVRPAPTPSLVFGCTSRKRKFFFKQWEKELLAYVHDKEAFRQNLMDNIAIITDLMTSVPDPVKCLAEDLQFFVDTHGRLYHLDLDRCFENKVKDNPLNTTLECIDKLKRRIHREISNRSKSGPKYVEAVPSVSIQSPGRESTLSHNSSMNIRRSSIDNPDDRDDSFWLENLKLGGNICCGYYKCFFLLKHLPDVAYVVTQAKDNHSQTKKLRSLSEAWQLGIHLEQNYSQVQLSLAPPVVIKLEEEFANKLNSNTYINCNTGKKISRQFSNGYVIVQKVRPAPTPSLIFGCASKTRKRFFKQWEKELLAYVHDKEAFRQNFTDNLATITNLMTSGPDPVRCLALDFQFFVDTYGRLYHLDLDRCFQNRVEEKHLNETLECIAELKEAILF